MAVRERETKRKHVVSEIGSEHGSHYFNGRMTDEEYLAKLKFPKGSTIYDQMRRSDPTVVAVLQSVFNPIKSAKWNVEPASESSEDVAVAEFVAKNLFPEKDRIKEGPDYNKSWEETLHEILLYIPFGFSIMEKVFTFIDDKIWLKKLSPRLPKTIDEFVFKDNSNTFLYADQKVNGIQYKLPAKRIVIFTANKEGALLSGISYLRPIYKPWTIKNDLQRIQASTFERYGMGTPLGKLPPDVAETDPEGISMKTALENITSNELSYMLIPNESEVAMLGGGAKTAPDMQGAIDYCDQQITISFLAQFLNLGVSSFGSRALGNTFVDFFTNSLEGIGDYIASRLNQELVQDLVDMNFEVEKYPKLVMSRIDSVDMDNIAVLADAGLLSSTFETEQTLRRIFRLPPITQEEYDEAKNPIEPEGSDANPDSKTDGKEKRGNNAKGKGKNNSKLNKKDAKKQLSDNIMARVRRILKRRRHLEDQ